MPALTRFALLTRPRCGSTYLATLLNSHPQVLCHGELFLEEGVVAVERWNADKAAAMDALCERFDVRRQDKLITVHRNECGANGDRGGIDPVEID